MPATLRPSGIYARNIGRHVLCKIFFRFSFFLFNRHFLLSKKKQIAGFFFTVKKRLPGQPTPRGHRCPSSRLMFIAGRVRHSTAVSRASARLPGSCAPTIQYEQKKRSNFVPVDLVIYTHTYMHRVLSTGERRVYLYIRTRRTLSYGWLTAIERLSLCSAERQNKLSHDRTTASNGSRSNIPGCAPQSRKKSAYLAMPTGVRASSRRGPQRSFLLSVILPWTANTMFCHVPKFCHVRGKNNNNYYYETDEFPTTQGQQPNPRKNWVKSGNLGDTCSHKSKNFFSWVELQKICTGNRLQETQPTQILRKTPRQKYNL